MNKKEQLREDEVVRRQTLSPRAQPKISEERIHKAIDSLEPRYVGFLQQFLRIPTPRMEENSAIHFLAQALREAGCEVEVFTGMGLGEATPAGAPLNLFAVKKGFGTGSSLLMEAHVDTVPTGSVQNWRHGPWSAEIEEGRIYARGAHDDRSGAALICMVADVLHRLNLEAAGDLYFLMTTEEEYSNGGMQSYVRKAERICPDAHLMIDGNQSGKCIIGHAAALSFQIRIPGPFSSAQDHSVVHTSNPIELMSELILDLRHFETQVNEGLKSGGVDPRWPPSTLAVTNVKSEGWFSNIPEGCMLSGFASVIPPQTIEDYKTSFERFFRAFGDRFPWLVSHPCEITWGPVQVPSMITSDTSPFLQLLQKVHSSVFGTALEERYIGGWGDPRLLGSPEIIFYGPGGGGGDHSYDEWYELKDLTPVLEVLVRMALAWTGCPRGNEA